MAAILFEAATGLLVTFAPFAASVQWSVLLHTVVGLLLLVPVTWYTLIHWLDYKRYNLSDAVLLGYVGGVALLLCAASGVVVTWQGLFGVRMSPLWRQVHLWSTYVLIVSALAHVAIVFVRGNKERAVPGLRRVGAIASITAVVGVVAVFALAALYGGPEYVNGLPEDYHYLYGEDRPFAPSLATTVTGGGLDPESLAGSESCGTAGCHSQIVEEWKPSAHRYAAMDPLFQKVQSVMAEQNGPESTRYCGGCHDPISLFSGAKNVFVEDLTGLHGYNEGISCLACHGVRETDLQGNANYVMAQPPAYLWQWRTEGVGKLASDFLIRTYPDQHNELSKRMFKAPEYCAACHKQFIDQEVNRVGWVQLQNQYDNWKASHWFVEGDPSRTIECRECHMPLVASNDPAAGDPVDYNRSPEDGMHRSHRFIAANSLVPALLELEGWQEQVELTAEWLKGDFRIPEIADKWPEGPVVELALDVPERAAPGERIPVRVILTANKVGHDFPTGPLDIIQSWINVRVTDDAGQVVFSSGDVDEEHFICPGSFMFKAEPVDRYGNLIDRHNLWEMVGVRFRRAVFPGFSDAANYAFSCPSDVAPAVAELNDTDGFASDFHVEAPARSRTLHVEAHLDYRKIDQYLINFIFGEDSGVTSPVVRMASDRKAIRIEGT
jgi:hypothetical protein